MNAVSAGTGPATARPLAASDSTAGPDDLDLLAAEVAALAGVRIQPADQDARRGKAKVLAQPSIEHDGRALERLARDGARHVGERQVSGRERDAQPSRDQQHHGMRVAALRSEILGMAPERYAGVVDRGFLDRRGDHRVEAAGQAALGGGVEQAEHVAGIGRVGMAGLDCAGEAHRQDRQRAGAVRRRRCVALPGTERESQAEQGGPRREQVRVAGENQFRRPVGERCGEREVRADARGLSGRDDEAARAQGFLIST